ncbi:MAG TPA: ergothioneine biosynthesis protein EgtB [Acidobacteriaceae bacterium]|jgi:ergothioneine biosynthesis protein EgtB|nr:ergothioneine biosynthesis protein EgtB [Acidobacteriaceae bacterium]
MPTPALTALPGTEKSAARLLEHYRAVRAQSEALTVPLSAEDQMVQSCAEASPVKWHMAHTSWFYETFVLREFVPAYRDFHPDFHWLFNSYYRTLGGELPEKKLRASFSRPAHTLVMAYRKHVDAHIANLLRHTPEDRVAGLIELGLQHEQQHQELIATDIKHAFFTNPLHPAYAESKVQPSVTPNALRQEWVEFAGGLKQIGHNGEGFCFDNELPRHNVFVQPFRLATRPVTCAEYLAFMEEGGYGRPELWLSEGWEICEAQGWNAPLYWQMQGGAWQIFTLGGWVSLGQLSESPVCHVSFFEADAYARWAGHRLPTEAEWELAASAIPIAGNLLNAGRLHPAVDENEESPSQKLSQIWGDVWEWTQSPYTGYPGYQSLPGALGEYNGKFMSSQMVLRGGSCVTPADHIRASYRNFFAPATRWQFSGIRLAHDNVSVTSAV